MTGKKEGSRGNVLKGALSSSISSLCPLFKDGFHKVADRVKETTQCIEKKVIESVVMAAILMTGFIFILIGVIYFINDHFMIERYWGFLIMGLVLVIVAALIRKQVEGQKCCGR